jgi:hypothetical protein
MTQVFIVGFGKFGKLALPGVQRLWKKARIWIIDRDPRAFETGRPPAGIGVLADGPQFLSTYQQFLRDEDWIIPSLPIHLAWKWLDLNLKPIAYPKAVIPPVELGSGLPYAQPFGKGLMVSYATFLCPDNCPAPLRFCTKTKEKRSAPLWKHLEDRKNPHGGLAVIESRQIAPGIGGFPFGELRRVLSLAQKTRPPLFLATACRCHGVIHGLTW